MSREGDAALVAALFAVDPRAMGGVCLRSPPQPAREQWLELLRDLLPAGTVVRKAPFDIPDGRLLGGLDLAATLQGGRAVVERGVLADADGGVVILSMAERLSAQTAARLNAVLDAGAVVMPREGVSIDSAARIGVVALDEGIGEEEGIPASLRDRMAFLLDLNGFSLRAILAPLHDRGDVEAARDRLPGVQIDDELLRVLCATALALGAGSPRVSVLAARAARAAAALDGRRYVTEADAVLAGRLVLACRASIAPAREPQPEQPTGEPTEPPQEAEPPPQAEPPQAEPPHGAESPPPAEPPQAVEESAPEREASDNQALQDRVLAAAQAAIPPGLLAHLRSGASERAARSSAAGRSGLLRSAGARGRPAGVRAGAPRGHARLNVIETLRAAAPWQKLRARNGAIGAAHQPAGARVLVRAEDFRVTRYKQRARTLTIFAVDASGSSALNRLAEAKGAVELLLAECYIRRDEVAVIAFRGRKAEVLLPPTRSLVRAKRSLAGLPGGGGTPLAAAIDAAAVLARSAQRRGETPTLVVLTDGSANIARNGAPGRELAHSDALTAARAVAAARIGALFVDTSPRPNVLARAIAGRMSAQYIPLPYANAQSLSALVRAATRYLP